MSDYYPVIPGAQGSDSTSQEAAESISGHVKALRYLVLRTLHLQGEATVLETVSSAGVTRKSLQPRFSELQAMGLIEPTGERRHNPSGKSATVLGLTDKGRATLWSSILKR